MLQFDRIGDVEWWKTSDDCILCGAQSGYQLFGWWSDRDTNVVCLVYQLGNVNLWEDGISSFVRKHFFCSLWFRWRIEDFCNFGLGHAHAAGKFEMHTH